MRKNLEITTNQFVCMLLSYTIVATELKYPAVMNSYAAQDGWIATALSGLYPIIFFILYGFVYKEYPYKNIFQINRELLGKIIGNIFNILFIIYLVCYAITHLAGFTILLVNTVISYYTNSQVILIIIIASSLATFYSFRSQLKLGQLTFYLLVFLILSLGFSLKDGKLLNIMPILSISSENLIKAVFHGIYAYAGFEIMLLYLPYLKNKKDYKKIAISTCTFLILILTWIVFITIFYFGPDTLNFFNFPLLNLTASIKVPLINNFILIFVTIWSIYSLKNSTLAITNVLNLLPPATNSKFKKLWLIIIIPFFYFTTNLMSNIINIVFFVNVIFIKLMLILLFNIFLLFIVVLRRKSYGRRKRKSSTTKNH
ncbi:hypothetical protein UT300003_04550 [Clostridium sardiniense]